jgi:hemolysin III
LRGVSHLLAVFIAAPAAVALWAGAEGFAARLGAVIFGTSLVALFAISAFYHRPTWGPRTRDLVGRLDQSAIFILIAGTYTPFGLLLNPESSHLLLGLIWASALGGVVLSLTWPAAPKPFMAGIYVLFGWVFVTFVPSLLRTVGPGVLVLIVLGGLFYTIGAAVYALQRPNPFPRVFGYHEVFHLFVVAGAALHFAAVSLTLSSLA